jgi:xylulokinase
VTLLAGRDVGTTCVKRLLVGPDGEVVACAEAGHALATPRPGWAEQDPDDCPASIVLGTSGVVFAAADAFAADPQARVHAFCHALRR